MKIRPLFGLLVFVTIFGGTLYVATRARGAQSRKPRVVVRLPIERNEPVRIRAVRVNGAKIYHRQDFLADDDWLRGLAVTIQNKTNKTIFFAAIDVQFPRPPGVGGSVAIHTLDYGNRDLLARKLRPGENSSRIAPGQSIDVSFNPRDVDRLGSLFKATGYQSASPEKLQLSVGHIIS